MTTYLSQLEKVGFVKHNFSNEKENLIEKAIARLWNREDGIKENTNWKIIKTSGKGFYDSSAELIVENKKTGDLLLVRAITNHFGRQGWKSPDLISCELIKEKANKINKQQPTTNISHLFGGFN